jgi:hypothetical protein
MRLKEFLQLSEAVKLDAAIKSLRDALYKDKLGLGDVGRAAVEKILDTLLASTGDLQTFKRYYERFMREEPDAMDLVLDELFAKLGVKSAEEFFAKAFLKEAAEPGDEDYDGDPAEVDTFWVVGWNDEESKAWVGEVTQRDSPKWVETASKGAAPSDWGGKRYMSYLSPDEVMSWLHRDYDEVEGPFFDEDEAIEHAEHKFGPLKEAWNDSGAKAAEGKWAEYRDGKIGVEAMATWLYGSRVHKKTKAEKLKSAYGAIAQQENTSKLISNAKGDALRAALKKKYGSED